MLSIGRVMSDISLFGYFSLSHLFRFVLFPVSRACHSTGANQIRCKRTWEDGDIMATEHVSLGKGK